MSRRFADRSRQTKSHSLLYSFQLRASFEARDPPGHPSLGYVRHSKAGMSMEPRCRKQRGSGLATFNRSPHIEAGPNLP